MDLEEIQYLELLNKEGLRSQGRFRSRRFLLMSQELVQRFSMWVQVQQMFKIVMQAAVKTVGLVGSGKEHGHLLACSKTCGAEAASAVLPLLAEHSSQLCRDCALRPIRTVAKQQTRCEDFEWALRACVLLN